MSDFNSSLPVRTQNNGDVVVKVSDGTVTSQQLAIDSSGRIAVKLDDGSGNAVTSQVNGAQAITAQFKSITGGTINVQEKNMSLFRVA